MMAFLRAVSATVWLMAGLAVLVLTGYRFWDTYTQRQYVMTQIATGKRQQTALYRKMDAELARWHRINTVIARDHLIKE